MAKKNQFEFDFPFYIYLNLFVRDERKKIYSEFKPLTRKFLHSNDPEYNSAFLRKPQFEALEMYVFLKEYCQNQHLHNIFEDWFKKQNRFEGRLSAGEDINRQTSIFDPLEVNTQEDLKTFSKIFDQISKFEQIYPNYIFSLAMGLGKTVLMATTIFYEFLLANKYPEDKAYCHNALVFAPDKTVLQSLKEILTFDKSKVIPPEYVNWLDTNLKFYFLDETGDSLNTIDNSRFNVIISNTQKIILKKQHKTRSAQEELFADSSNLYKAKSVNKAFEDLYDFGVDNEADLLMNQRFAKLMRMEQLGIYVDEAHHVFGSKLAVDFGLKDTATSLRNTINQLAINLMEAGTNVVGCYNYTGTPYIGSQTLPEVVYSYGLRESIDNQYLKRVDLKSFKNVKDKTTAFVRLAINEFWNENKDKRFEKMLPKLALFASTIEELQKQLRPAVEKVLGELNIPISRILVNVGDEKITSNDDIREFNSLDTPASEKQFILLVGKGKEGWNCRSLFGVALHREPKSKVFVLQATMRCLRSIGTVQETGQVFLSEENVRILDDELQKNFKMTIDDFKGAGSNTQNIEVRLVAKPPIKVKFRKVTKLHQLKEKEIPAVIDLELEKCDVEKYKITGKKKAFLAPDKKIGPEIDYSKYKDRQEFSSYTLVAEIARYLTISPLKVKSMLSSCNESLDEITNRVNEYNEIVYDWIIPKLFNSVYEIKEFENKEDIEVELIKEPKDGDCYRITAKKDLIASLNDSKYESYKDKSFHVDNYCFDSQPENRLFWTLLHDNRLRNIWFTGMFTHGQTDFYISYIDPVSHTVRNYYPDFLALMKDGTYVIIEVKGDNKIDDEVVRAKAEYARQLAHASQMNYVMVKGSDAMAGHSI